MEGERHLWIWYTPFGLGGVETFLLNVCRELVRSGVQVCVAAVYAADGPLRAEFAEAGIGWLDWTGFQPAYMGNEPAAPICLRLAKDIADFRPTLVAMNDCTDFALGALPMLRRLRPFCTVLDTLHIDGPDEGYLRRRRPCVSVLDGITGTNQHVIDRFHRTVARPGRLPARYVANGVRVPERDRRRPGGTLRLLYVGRIAQEQKRILELPPILERLRAAGRAFSMTIVGDGPQRQALQAELEAKGLTEQVRMAGFVPPAQVLDYYLDHDVVLNLSRYEGFSMTILEALASGCVPVCSDLPCLDRAVFRDGDTCRLFPVNSPAHAAEALARLTPENLQRLSSAARAIGRVYTVERTVDEYLDFVAELRQTRPLQPWPLDMSAALSVSWDLTRLNPWLPHPNPVRRLARNAWNRLRQLVRRGA